MSVRVTKAPNMVWHSPSNDGIFLAGSIEQGLAQHWQEEVTTYFQSKFRLGNINILNPRRDYWNAELSQSIDEPEFLEQVYWELDTMEEAKYVFMYFDPSTKSPITLFELGLCAGLRKKLVVCCPDGFYRRGNVEIICQKFNIPLFKNRDAALKYCYLNWDFN